MDSIRNHFSLTRRPADNPMASMPGPPGSPPMPISPLTVDRGMIWDSQPTKKLILGRDSLSRPQLEKWLYSFFLKLCIPAPREPEDIPPMNSPLNLTAFLRLISHLHEIGYPAH